MMLPTTARTRTIVFALLTTAVMLTACAGEATAPTTGALPASELRTSPFIPSPATKSLVGVSDGTYTFTIDPQQDQTLALGASRLYLPGRAICKLATSSYGAAYWNDNCAVQSDTLTITAVVRNAATDHPSVEFQPAMRFSPKANVWLYLALSDRVSLDNSRLVKYCNETGCVDESIADPSLTSYVDTEHKVIFRRIKHFSGYVVTNLVQDVGELLAW